MISEKDITHTTRKFNDLLRHAYSKGRVTSVYPCMRIGMEIDNKINID